MLCTRLRYFYQKRVNYFVSRGWNRGGRVFLKLLLQRLRSNKLSVYAVSFFFLNAVWSLCIHVSAKSVHVCDTTHQEEIAFFINYEMVKTQAPYPNRTYFISSTEPKLSVVDCRCRYRWRVGRFCKHFIFWIFFHFQ